MGKGTRPRTWSRRPFSKPDSRLVSRPVPRCVVQRGGQRVRGPRAVTEFCVWSGLKEEAEVVVEVDVGGGSRCLYFVSVDRRQLS